MKRFLLQLPAFIWLISIYLVVSHLLAKTSTTWSAEEYNIFIGEILLGVVSFIIVSIQVTSYINKKYQGFKADIYSLLAIGSLLITSVAAILAVLILGVNMQKGEELKEKPVKAATHNLISSGIKLGSSGKEVSILQAALKRDTSLYPSGLVTGYYGAQTKEAVMNFQEKYDLEQTGEVDQATADKFNEVYGNQSEEYYISSSPSPTKTVVKNNYVDPDPVINCNLSVNCGGGTRQLKRSICEQSTCCQIGNTWLFYESKSKCIEDQNRNAQQYNNYIPPTYAPLPTWAPLPTYAPLPTWAPLPTIDYSYEYVAPTIDPEQCKREVIQNGYDERSIQVYCGNLLAPYNATESSAYNLCIKVKQEERERLFKDCEN